MYTSIVVGTDGSERAERAVEQAAELARQFAATLHVVEAIGADSVVATAPGGAAAMAFTESAVAAIRDDVDRRVQGIRQTGVTVETHIVPKAAPVALCDVAKDVGADLIVVGNRGMTGKGRFLGSVPNSVSHNAPCSVLIAETGD